jgi:hypothetical protein
VNLDIARPVLGYLVLVRIVMSNRPLERTGAGAPVCDRPGRLALAPQRAGR